MNSRKAAGAFIEKVNVFVFDDTFVYSSGMLRTVSAYKKLIPVVHRAFRASFTTTSCFILPILFPLFLQLN